MSPPACSHRVPKVWRSACGVRDAKVLNHVEGGPAATRVYDRYDYDAEKRDALDRWARGLVAIIEGKTKRVVAFRA